MTFPSSSKFHTLEREKERKNTLLISQQLALGLHNSSGSSTAGGNFIYPRGFAPTNFPLVNKTHGFCK